LDLLYLGIGTAQLKSIVNINSEIYDKIVDELVSRNSISIEEIEQFRKEREDNIKETTCKLRIKGYSCKEIANRIPYCKEKTIKKTSARLRKRNILTEDDMKIANIEKRVREIVLSGLKEGLSNQEIISSCKVKTLDDKMLQGYISDFVEDGDITRGQIIKTREKRQEREKGEREQREQDIKDPERYEREIEVLYRLGFSGRQIMQLTQLSSSYVRRIRDKVGISAKQSEEWQKAQEEMAESRRMAISKMATTKRELEDDLVKTHIEYVKGKLQLGDVDENDVKLISRIIPMFEQFITNSNVNLIATYYTRYKDKVTALKFFNKCLDNPEIDTNIKNKIEQAKQGVIIQSQKYEAQEKIGYYQKEIKIGEKPIRRIEFIRKQIKAMILLDIKLNVKHVEGLIEVIKANKTLGIETSNDMELLRQVIQMYPELMIEQNIDTVVDEFLRTRNKSRATLFVNECITTCYEAGAKFRESGNRLLVYRAEIDKKSEEIKHERETERRNKLGVQISGLQSSEGVSSVSINNGNRKLPPEEVEH